MISRRFLGNVSSRGSLVCLMALCLAILIGQGQALVLHPTGAPPVNWTGQPHDSVVGRWATNASCVAVGPNHIITTRHQKGGVGNSVIFAGVSYKVAQEWIEPDEPGSLGNADLRVCRIETPNDQPANLQHYVQLYTATDEVGQQPVFGGYGKGRGNTLWTNNNKPYAYIWDNSFGNTIQRWGTNRIDSFPPSPLETVLEEVALLTESLFVDFDDLNVTGATPYEAATADFDSGSGAFVPCGSSWKVLGLNAFVLGNSEGHGSDISAFRKSSNTNLPDPELLGVVRISAYAAWINGIVPVNNCVTYLPDLDGNCLVANFELNQLAQNWGRQDCSAGNNHCDGVDWFQDGSINLTDYGYLASWWMVSADLLTCN